MPTGGHRQTRISVKLWNSHPIRVHPCPSVVPLSAHIQFFRSATRLPARFAPGARELPFGSLPVLDVGGAAPTRIAQSNAILRYAGKLTGLYPNDPMDALRVDELIEFAEDINHALSPSMREPDMEKKLAMRKVLVDESIPLWCKYLETKLAANTDPTHFVGSSLTVADLKLLHGLDQLVSGNLDGVPKTVLDPYEKLQAWRAAVRKERDAKVAG